MCKSKIIIVHFLLLAVLILHQGCTGVKSASKGLSDEVIGSINPVVGSSEKEQNGVEEGTARVTEYILGPGDKLEITVYRNDDLKRTLQIDSSGKIMYPLVGDIHVAGLSIFQLRDKIREGLSKYIIGPEVSVSVTAVQSQKVIILGEVKSPGFFQIETSLTVLEAISMAGGFTLDGKKKNVLLIRGGMNKPELKVLDLEKVLRKGDMTDDVVLMRGDIIYVSRTHIANVDRFFTHLATIISPLLSAEMGYYIADKIGSDSGQTAIVPAR